MASCRGATFGPWCVALSIAVVGCGSGGHPTAASASAVSPSPRSSFSSATALSACCASQFTSEQFTGDWTEPDGGGIITTLNPDGTLTQRGGNMPSRSGKWSYEAWQQTPGKGSMPAGEENQCVLWLWKGSDDLLYYPLAVSDTSVQVSYIGRGNTLTWVRPGPVTR
jgi:hypothetical protein